MHRSLLCGYTFLYVQKSGEGNTHIVYVLLFLSRGKCKATLLLCVGWFLFIPGLILGIVFLICESDIRFFNFKVFSIAEQAIFSDKNFFSKENNKNDQNSAWQMKSNYRSPCYTTSWCDIPIVKV